MLTLILISLSLLLLPLFKLSNYWLISRTSILLTPILIIILKQTTYSLSLFTPYIFIDYLSSPLIILTLWISALIILSRIQIKHNFNSPAMFLFLIAFLNILLILSFSSSNIILFYLFFEATLIPTMFIIIGWGYQPERLQAGFYLILYTVLASLPLIIRITIIYKNNSTLFIFFPNFWHQPISAITRLWWLITILAFIAKIPLYTLHLWLPKAHVEAPVAGSIILAGLLLKLGRYGLIRLSYLYPWINKSLIAPISRIALWGAIITSIICLRQPDIKSLIAYSSIGHIALLTAGIISGSSWGWESSLIIIIAHGLCSSALFSLANIQYEATQTRNIFLTKGILSIFPIITFMWFILCSANIAAPPSLNLIAEIILLSSILSINLLTAPLLILSSFLRGAYSLILFTTMQHGTPSNSINPIQLFTQRNYFIIILHLFPLVLLCFKLDLIISWLI